MLYKESGAVTPSDTNYHLLHPTAVAPRPSESALTSRRQITRIRSITTSLTAESITSLHPKTERPNATRIRSKSEGGWLRMRCSKTRDHVFTDGSLANQPRAAAAFPYTRKLMTVDIVAKCPERGCSVLITEVLQCYGSFLSSWFRAS